MPVVILFDESDVAARPPGNGPFLALAPPARLAAVRQGLSAASSRERYSDCRHARSAAAARKALREFDRSTAREDLPPSIRLMARHSAWQLALIASRLILTLPTSACLVRSSEGWKETAARDEQLEALLPRILNAGLAHRLRAGRPSAPGLHRFLTRRAASAMAGRSTKWIAAPGGKLKLGMERAIREAGFALAAIRMTVGDWSDYAGAGRAWLREGTEIRVGPLSGNDHRVTGLLEALDRAGGGFSDPAMRSAWRLYRPYLQANLGAMLAVLTEGGHLLDLLGARGAVSYESNSWTSAALLEAAGRLERGAIVANHNSHAKTGAAIADFMLGTLRAHRIDNDLVRTAVEWSPQWAAWTETRSAVKHFQYRLKYPAAERREGRFRILHASNYQNWSEFMPWIAQTSDEYLESIAALAHAVSGRDDLELTIRLRAKKEVDGRIVRELVPPAANVTISDSEIGFLEQMAAHDLLVSHFSTTAEQALQMGKPVLLWGSTQRYCQFPPRWTPPDAASRAPVYAVRDAAKLPAMLAAIREQHWGRPLSAQETERYRNRPEDPDLSGLATRLLSGA